MIARWILTVEQTACVERGGTCNPLGTGRAENSGHRKCGDRFQMHHIPDPRSQSRKSHASWGGPSRMVRSKALDVETVQMLAWRTLKRDTIEKRNRERGLNTDFPELV